MALTPQQRKQQREEMKALRAQIQQINPALTIASDATIIDLLAIIKDLASKPVVDEKPTEQFNVRITPTLKSEIDNLAKNTRKKKHELMELAFRPLIAGQKK